MKRFIIVLGLIALISTISTEAKVKKGIVKGTASAVKDLSQGVYGLAVNTGKVVSFPVVHPKKSYHGVKKAVQGATKL